ncbi:MAG: IclR family transcriptional regulator C-terminal domain-containing protein [Gemmobacter sp.]
MTKDHETDQGTGKRTSIERVLGILDLFTEERPAWTVDMMMLELGQSRATTYRYVKVLADSGLLAPAAGGSYVLGSRFIQIDRQIRRTDPLLRVATPILAQEQAPVIGAKIISSFYGTQVLSIHVEQSDHLITLLMERGRTFPLLFGAPSRIILAYLPSYQLRNVYTSNRDEIARIGLGDSWEAFRAAIKKIRNAGYYVSTGMLDHSTMGVAAPIFHAPGVVSASLCYVRRRAICTAEDTLELTRLVTQTARQISGQLQQFTPEDGQPSTAFPTPRVAG